MSDTWALYARANHELNEGLIRLERSISTGSIPHGDPKRRLRKLDDRRRFFAAVGDPQRTAPPVIHITGTAGKGTLALGVARELQAVGWRVGLHVTPYLQIATEKIWIDGRYIEAEDFSRSLAGILPVARRFRDDPDTIASIHGMASVAHFFAASQEMDVLVLEAGCGARYDLTNVAGMDVLCSAVTNIGEDHLKTLGGSLSSIAWHKAGVIKPGRPVVSGVEDPEGEIIDEEARSLDAPIKKIPGGSIAELTTALAGIANRELHHRSMPKGTQGPPFPEALPGRMEITRLGDQQIILDGAHNGVKMSFLCNWLRDRGHSDMTCIFGCLRSKDATVLLEALRPLVKHWIFSPVPVYGKTSAEPIELGGIQDGTMTASPAEAMEVAAGSDTILVTGSLYLIGAIRNMIHSPMDVLRERSSWPRRLTEDQA